MEGIRRFYNQNRKQIWMFIGIVAAIIVILQLLNYATIKKMENEQSAQATETAQNIVPQYNNIGLESEKTAITGESISEKQKDEVKAIDQFFEYCNEGNVQEAYNLLTEDCKDEMYSSLQIFDEMYYQKVINGEKKNITVENWNSNIYKVKITPDILSNGNYDKQNTLQDYITIVQNENDEYKLNINGYIGKRKVEEESDYDGFNIKVLTEDRYMNYTTYTFEITNNSDKDILLDSLNNINSMYIEDANGSKYSAYTHELAESQLTFDIGTKKQIKIKYYSKYQSNKTITRAVFSNVTIYEDSEEGDNEYSLMEVEI